MNKNKNKIKLLATRLKAAKSELAICEETLTNSAAEIEKIFEEKYNVKSHTPKNEKDICDYNTEEKDCKKQLGERGPSSADPQIKSLFRKIAIKIHPDKLYGIESEFEKSAKRDMFLAALQASEKSDIISLAYIAIELGIGPPEVSEQKFIEFEKQISTIKIDVSHIQSTMAWNWWMSPAGPQKDAILEKLLNLMYKEYEKNNSRT